MTIPLASLITVVVAMILIRASTVSRIPGFEMRFPRPRRRDRRRHAQFVQAGGSPLWIRERTLKGARHVAVRLRAMKAAVARGAGTSQRRSPRS
jgi:hypothetical protein